ncbi:MAG TPA: prepilin-type N-terminal cleavage/methylation domain-containing protein [Candidatus Saccharimonadales bacterium]|nr:prepilin-type N-terminal cleavage/methylation domain-containing protein [Candidatus Saccharimonadales bacterium]
MLNKIKRSRNDGFTIIEVMIVLAIAALILLIVLLAVPALQRNSRNTAIKNDASAITAAVSEFGSNNEGATPTVGGAGGSSANGSTVTIGGGNTTTPATAKIQSSTQVLFVGTPGTTQGQIVVRFGQKCQSSSSFNLVSSRRSTAVLYNIETSSSQAPRCVDS